MCVISVPGRLRVLLRPPTRKSLEKSRVFVHKELILEDTPIEKQIRECEKENREFSQLRDWLLPMLMNGQAHVKNGGDESA